MVSNQKLFSVGNFDFRLQHLLVIGILALSVNFQAAGLILQIFQMLIMYPSQIAVENRGSGVLTCERTRTLN